MAVDFDNVRMEAQLWGVDEKCKKIGPFKRVTLDRIAGFGAPTTEALLAAYGVTGQYSYLAVRWLHPRPPGTVNPYGVHFRDTRSLVFRPSFDRILSGALDAPNLRT